MPDIQISTISPKGFGVSSQTTRERPHLLRNNLEERVTRRLAALLIVLLSALASMLAVAAPASGETLPCRSSGYTCTPGYTGNNASSVPWAWRYYGGSYAATNNGTHNCTLYVAWRLSKSGMGDPGRNWGNAVTWKNHLRSDKTPAVGSVAWWGASRGGGAGHVAYVEQVRGGDVLLRADNFVQAGGYTSAAWTAVSSVEAFLHPHDTGTSSPTPSSGSGNPFGHLDSVTRAPGGLRAQGWVIDPDTTSPIEAHAYSGNGNPGGGNPGAATRADRNRPDVARAYPGKGAAHGFDVTVPARGPGQQTACVYGINVGSGNTNPRIGCGSLNVSPDPYGHLDSVRRVVGGVEARGWAIDPDSDAPIAVHVYGGTGAPGAGNPGVPTTAGQDRPDVANAYPNYGSRHGFTVVLPTGPQPQTVCAYGINNGPGTNPQIGCQRV